MSWVSRNQEPHQDLLSIEKKAGRKDGDFLGKNSRSKSEFEQVTDSVHSMLGISQSHERKGTGTNARKQKSRAERLAKPMRQRCKAGQNGHPVTSLDWTMYHASQVPGPGAYNTSVKRGDLKLSGRFANTKLRTLVEDEVHLKKHLPGPQDYNLPACFPDVAAGRKISEFRPKTDLEWELHRSKGIPGANQYDTALPWKTTGAAIGGGKRSDQWRGNDNPGPGEHGEIPSLIRDLKGGKIPEAIVKTDVEWKEITARQIPGPGNYSIESDPRTILPKGGKINPTKAKTDLEMYIDTFASNPGPGEYPAGPSSLSKKGGYLCRSGIKPFSVP